MLLFDQHACKCWSATRSQPQNTILCMSSECSICPDRIPPLYTPVDSDAAEILQEEGRDVTAIFANPDSGKQPMLQRAGPSEAFSKLQIERSGPSGNFSKLYNLKVRAFAHDMSRSTADDASP